MVAFNFWSNASSKAVDSTVHDVSSKPTTEVQPVPEAVVNGKNTVEKHPPITSIPSEITPTSPASPNPNVSPKLSFNLFPRRTYQKPLVTTEQERKKEHKVTEELKHAILLDKSSSRSDKRAKESAEIVRSLIVGPDSINLVSKKSKPLSKAQMDKVKSDLTKPKAANRVIAQLRQLDLDAPASSRPISKARSRGPIQAVCLDSPEEDIGQRHFARLKADAKSPDAEPPEAVPSIVNASAESIASIFGDLHVVSFLSGDLGLGQPGDGPGILSGALPTAETIINGITVITPQLMSLGYATGQAFLPDHKGIYPPTDRMSVLTYWWGLEVLLPPPSLKYLDNAQSISHTVLNFMTAIAAVNNGVREILPFVRYISQFMEFEFNTIKSQNKGQGVVCAATWIMPAALVPRPWDFETPVEPLPPTDPTADDPAQSIPDSTDPSEELDPDLDSPPEQEPALVKQPSDHLPENPVHQPSDVVMVPPVIGVPQIPVAVA